MSHPEQSTSGRGWTWFDPMATKWMLRVPVVYAIYYVGQLVYIGQTQLRSRFLSHRSERFNSAKACVMPNQGERKALERLLISRLKPRFNHQFTGRIKPRYEVIPGGDAYDVKDIVRVR